MRTYTLIFQINIDLMQWIYCNDRLFYFMLVAKYRNCGSCLPVDGMSIDFMIYTLCAMVWHERNLIIEMNIPNQLKDLLLEQSKWHARNDFDQMEKRGGGKCEEKRPPLTQKKKIKKFVKKIKKNQLVKQII